MWSHFTHLKLLTFKPCIPWETWETVPYLFRPPPCKMGMETTLPTARELDRHGEVRLASDSSLFLAMPRLPGDWLLQPHLSRSTQFRSQLKKMFARKVFWKVLFIETHLIVQRR